MAHPAEQRPDDCSELPTRIPFAGPHPGTVERDWQPAALPGSPPEPAGHRPRSPLPVGALRQREPGLTGAAFGNTGRRARGPVLPTEAPEVLHGSVTGPGFAAASPEHAFAAAPLAIAAREWNAPPLATDTPKRPRPAVAEAATGRPRRSRVLVAVVAAVVVVAGGLWWSRDPAAPPTARVVLPPIAVPALPITEPEATASAGSSSTAASPSSSPSAPASSAAGSASAPPTSPYPMPPVAVPSPEAPAEVNTSGRDLALGAEATASSVQRPGREPELVVDRSSVTRWSSRFSDPQWLAVDLGREWQISEIRLRWGFAHATAYRVEVSSDGYTWQPVFSTTRGRGGDITLRLPQVPGRVVRVVGFRRSTVFGYSLRGVEVR